MPASTLCVYSDLSVLDCRVFGSEEALAAAEQRILSDVRFYPDCVAKLFAALRERNNRISPNSALNQCCVSAFVRETILLVWVRFTQSGHRNWLCLGMYG